jgi:hypothetical protein
MHNQQTTKETKTNTKDFGKKIHGKKREKKFKLLTLRDFQEHPSNCSNSLLLDLHKI